jgi:hypothetical protein
MSARLPWSAATAAACGIDVLRQAISPGCGFGRAALSRERVYAAGDEAAARAAAGRVAGVAAEAGIERLGRIRAALAAAPDPVPAVARARGGEILSDADFFDLMRFDAALRDLAALCAGTPLAVPEPDPTLSAALAPGRRPGRSFHLDDAFDAGLRSVRAAAAAAQAAYDAARSRLVTRAATAAGIATIRDGEFVLMRDAVPATLPPEIRVVREAPTYLLCELALDAEALATLAARDAAAARVAAVEEAVRARLSAAVTVAAAALQDACARLGDLDLLAARAAFAVRHACVVPELVDAGGIALEEARFPPLEALLTEHGRRYVPISFELDGLGVVTGPNMGGKTVALRTLGFAAACAALGVPVPARAARLPLFDEIVWLGIGLGSAPAGDAALLSAFGTEVVALRAVLERPARPTLVLVDEFARTTSPREGRALLIALLGTLAERGVAGLVTTHLADIAAAAGVVHFAAGRLRELPAPAAGPLALDEALERIAGAMDYALVRVAESAPEDSDALALAAALGLDPALIARAAGVLGAPFTSP